MSRFKKVGEIIVVIVAGGALMMSGFFLGWASGAKHPQNITVTGVTGNGTSSIAASADFSTFWQAWQEVNDLYLRNPSTTAQGKVQGSIAGLVNSLGDPYSEYFTPQASKQFQQNINGNFGGIGAVLGLATSSQIVIISPMKGTPAAIAGLKAGDAIVAVNGTSTQGMFIDDAVTLIRGEIGTKVKLTIFRAGWKAPQDFTLTRANISVPTVDFSMKGKVAYIALHEFTQGADSLFYNALKQAVDANAQGIVLDLRDDPGGYLEVAVDLSGYFLKPGSQVVKEVGRSVPEQNYTAAGNGALANMPMVVLINGGSASAAEILAGALHDDRGIKLIGEKSFGKGTVQQVLDLADGSSIKLTVAHWVMPSGRILDHDGIIPDYMVSMPTSTGAIASGTDPQLDKALQVLQDEIKAGK